MGAGKGKSRRVRATNGSGSKPIAKKAKENFASLIPNGDKWLENDLNVLLVGLHGTGKTEALLQLAKKHGLKLKYYSAATLDPYTDLVGVPVPTENEETGSKNLEFIRPHDVDDAEVIFMDEINRAHPKVLNAILEMVQFRSINGEKLPKLRAVWGGMNPAGADYDVEELDPALLDRFDVYKDLRPNPSVAYMSRSLPDGTRNMRKEVAQALVAWWKGHDNEKRENYVSPRRLEKLGLLYEKIGNISDGLPPWGKFEIKKLQEMLAAATVTEDEKKRIAEKAAAEAKKRGLTNTKPLEPNEVKATAGWLEKNAERVANHIRVMPTDTATITIASDGLKKVGATKVNQYAPILDALPPKDLEKVFADRKFGFRNKVARGLEEKYPDFEKQFPEAWKKLQKCNVITGTCARHWGKDPLAATKKTP